MAADQSFARLIPIEKRITPSPRKSREEINVARLNVHGSLDPDPLVESARCGAPRLNIKEDVQALDEAAEEVRSMSFSGRLATAPEDAQ